MSIVLPSFDPTQATASSFQTQMGTNAGILIMTNHSGVTLTLTFGDGSQKNLWAQTSRQFLIDPAVPTIAWKQANVLFVSGGYNRVDLELYAVDEEIPDVLPIALTSPNVSAASNFRTAAAVGAIAAYPTFTQAGIFISIGDFPFANNEITNGLAISGQIYFFAYSVTVTQIPGFQDGTTVHGNTVYVRLAIYDSSHSNVTTYIDGSDGAVFIGNVSSRGGDDNGYAAVGSAIPVSIAVQVAAGGGAPYYATAEVAQANKYPAGLSPAAAVLATWTISAVPPPALT